MGLVPILSILRSQLNSTRHPVALLAAVFALLTTPISRSQSADSSVELGIDHRYSNTDAQSLIGLPMGSHKTTVEKDGSLRWSQWSLKRKPLDVPIGFSSQMDGALAIEPFVDANGTLLT